MPGNKNSGRKKKDVVIPVSDIDCAEAHDVVVKKKNVGGRPRKQESEATTTELVVDLPDAEKHSDCTAKRTKQHVVDLSKRSSSLSNLYSENLGEPLEKFPPRMLPLKRIVLQRYRSLRSSSHKAPKSELIGAITNELLQLWESSSIPPAIPTVKRVKWLKT